MPARNQDEPETGSRCEITGEHLSKRELVTLDHLHPALADRIKNDFPALHADALISRKEADRYRILYVEELLKQERGELTEIDKQVARSLAEGEMVSQNVEEDYKGTRTLGERMADGLATFGGSWMFLITFGILLVIWMAINAVAGNQSAFDPYPFILLNLVLSCLAATGHLAFLLDCSILDRRSPRPGRSVLRGTSAVQRSAIRSETALIPIRSHYNPTWSDGPL